MRYTTPTRSIQAFSADVSLEWWKRLVGVLSDGGAMIEKGALSFEVPVGRASALNAAAADRSR
jgi:hypothetical protein